MLITHMPIYFFVIIEFWGDCSPWSAVVNTFSNPKEISPELNWIIYRPLRTTQLWRFVFLRRNMTVFAIPNHLRMWLELFFCFSRFFFVALWCTKWGLKMQRMSCRECGITMSTHNSRNEPKEGKRAACLPRYRVPKSWTRHCFSVENISRISCRLLPICSSIANIPI